MPTTLYFEPDLALSIANTRDSGVHAHRAIQLTLALAGGFRIADATGTLRETCFAALAPEETHRVLGDGARIAYLFVDPGVRAWQAWLATGATPAVPVPALVTALRELGSAPRDGDRARRLAQDWRAQSLPGLFDAAPGDARIARAIAAVDADPSADTDHRALAALAHLSPSRFAERFRAETGMPVRNYLLWRRLLFAVTRLEHGDSVTTAAHIAGFSDAAHLSRSFRRIIGAAPSDLAVGRVLTRRRPLHACVGS